jgi:transposase
MKCRTTLRYIGLDVHKKWMQICILDARGKVRYEGRTAATPDQLRGFTRTLRPTDAVALEATINTWAIVALIEQRAGRVVVSNPMRTKAIASAKIKTDKVDARVLADLLRCDYLPAVWRPDAQTILWRQCVRFSDRFVRRRTQLKNQIHAIFHQNLLVFPGADLFGKTGRGWIERMRPTLPERDRFELDLLLDELDHTEAVIALLEKDLATTAYPLDNVRLLMTIHGVDAYGALSLLAAIGDVKRFASPKKLVSYFGLHSSVFQSADHCYTGPITKRGRSHARWIAIQAAQSLCRARGPLAHFYAKIKKRKGHNVAVVAVARKLVTIAWHMLTHREPYRYAVPKTTEGKLARLRVLATGTKKKTGPKTGTPRSTNHGTGRRVKYAKSLNQVLAENELPAIAQLPAGELRILSQRNMKARVVENIYKGKPIITTNNNKHNSGSPKHKTTHNKGRKTSCA